MNFEWESETERLKRHMRISPKKKLEWLAELLEFKNASLKGRKRKLWFKERESR